MHKLDVTIERRCFSNVVLELYDVFLNNDSTFDRPDIQIFGVASIRSSVSPGFEAFSVLKSLLEVVQL